VALRALYDRECSLNDLSQAIHCDHTAASRLVERLVQKRLVNRQTAPKDRRSVRVSLTATALDLVPKLAAIADGHDETFFAKISKADKERLLQIVTQLIQEHEIRPGVMELGSNWK
jgi:DNA-binding MarR family transcriptional regulator